MESGEKATVTAIAEESGVSRETINAARKGARSPSQETLDKLAGAFGLPAWGAPTYPRPAGGSAPVVREPGDRVAALVLRIRLLGKELQAATEELTEELEALSARGYGTTPPLGDQGSAVPEEIERYVAEGTAEKPPKDRRRSG
jgi:transcriptional regulator with XRE-family HTH domain